MFIFILSKLEEDSCKNFPKYTIVIKSSSSCYFHKNVDFYYLVSANKNCTNISSKIPKFLIVLDLYFDMYTAISIDKFNLSKLGVDYIINKLAMHFKDECISSYPENYVFVNEPDWPRSIYGTDRTSLKRSYRSKTQLF